MEFPFSRLHLIHPPFRDVTAAGDAQHPSISEHDVAL